MCRRRCPAVRRLILEPSVPRCFGGRARSPEPAKLVTLGKASGSMADAPLRPRAIPHRSSRSDIAVCCGHIARGYWRSTSPSRPESPHDQANHQDLCGPTRNKAQGHSGLVAPRRPASPSVRNRHAIGRGQPIQPNRTRRRGIDPGRHVKFRFPSAVAAAQQGQKSETPWTYRQVRLDPECRWRFQQRCSSYWLCGRCRSCLRSASRAPSGWHRAVMRWRYRR
jgi:hypothetical protein